VYQFVSEWALQTRPTLALAALMHWGQEAELSAVGGLRKKKKNTLIIVYFW